jgi:hypothetical protein
VIFQEVVHSIETGEAVCNEQGGSSEESNGLSQECSLDGNQSRAAGAQWTLWRTRNHSFPLCDSPVMIDRDSVMVALSPRLLLEIDLTVPAPELPWIVHEDLPERKFAEFRNRCIGNSFKEIIFSGKQVLLDWLVSEELAVRIATLKGPARNQECMWESMLRTNYGLSGFGRGPKEFESLLAKGSLDLSRP